MALMDLVLELESYKGEDGTNIILELGRGNKEIIIASNYDSFENSPGANGNASGVSVLLDVYRRVLEYKKKGLLNNKTKFILFGKEEPNFAHPKGRIGSRAYIEKHASEVKKIVTVCNLSLCGEGEMIALWPVVQENSESRILEIARKVFEKIQIDFESTERMSRVTSSSESFFEEGIENSFCFMAIKKSDKDDIKHFSESVPAEIAFRNVLGLFSRSLKVRTPNLFMHYRNSEDKSSYLNEASLRMMSDAAFNFIVNLDRKLAPSPLELSP
ncbi:M28 family peptidase [Candidatus Pacearchaeota archaeon]|nr:M28 family peptidase [Candidatus Pacearchaeota archaeon]